MTGLDELEKAAHSVGNKARALKAAQQEFYDAVDVYMKTASKLADEAQSRLELKLLARGKTDD